MSYDRSSVSSRHALVDRPLPERAGYIRIITLRGIECMQRALWYLIVGMRGGKNRARIIQELDRQPRNANDLADILDLDYNTVRHHLTMLVDHGVIEDGEQEYGKLYFLSEQFDQYRDEFDSIMENVT